MTRFLSHSVAAILVTSFLVVAMGETKVAAAEKSGTVILDGLKNPCGVAVQPETGDVLVSDSGAGRIVRVNPASAGKAEDVIVKFPRDVYGKGPMYDIGPLGLAFLDKDTLVVGGGGLVDGEEIVRFYQVPAAGKTIEAADMKYQAGPLGPSDETLKGEGNFYGVAVTKRAVYLTCNGDDTKGWVSRVVLKNGKPRKLKPFIATKQAVEVDAPVGIAIGKGGKLVVGQMGEINVPTDSLLTSYDPKTGKLESSAETGLFDIAALAFSPRDGALYALDFAWMDTAQGGLFRLDVSKDGDDYKVDAVKIMGLDKPAAMAFAPNGTLYVAVFGTAEGDEKPGKLIEVRGL